MIRSRHCKTVQHFVFVYKDSFRFRIYVAIVEVDLFYFYFYFLLFTTILSQWDFSHGKLGSLSPGKASYDRVSLPNLGCMLDV